MATGIFKLRDQLIALTQGAWTSQKTIFVEYLVVAGGGAGGTDRAGGGGGGGLLQGIVSVTAGSSITVTVGAGGTTTGGGTNPTGGNGVNSVFGSITAKAGGGGSGGDARYNGYQPASGGSGGGESTGDIGNLQGAQGTAGQGNAGGTSGPHSGNYNAAGGGGAGTVGLNAVGTVSGNGGAGIASSISGTVTTYSGGGGGGTYGGTAGSGGVGGGGAGAAGTTAIAGTAGSTNTGGAGGGGGGANGAGGAGGSGICIISYPDIYNAPTALTGTYTASTSGSGSVSLNGSSQYLSIPTSSVFAFGTGDFTLEAFIYTNSSSSQYIIALNKGTGPECSLYLSSGVLTYYDPTAGNKSSGVTPSLNAWHHVAVCRASGVISFYVDGVKSGSTYSVTTSIANTSDSYFGGSSGGADFSGYATNFRVVKGVAVYTGNFTTPTSPLTATQIAGTNISAITGTQTSALLNTVSGAQFADSSTNSFAPSAFGSLTWNQLSPFATGLGYKNRVYTWTGSGTVTF